MQGRTFTRIALAAFLSATALTGAPQVFAPAAAIAAPRVSPLPETLTKRAEQALYSNREPADVVLAHFAVRQPLTSQGALALARARLATGDATGGGKLGGQGGG